MLIAKEMSKETESKRKSLSVVAQLMGIDDQLLAQQDVPISNERKLQEDYSSTTLAGALKGCHQQEAINSDDPISSKHQRYVYNKMEFKDAYEVSQKPSRASVIKDQWGNCNEYWNVNKNAIFDRKQIMETKFLTEDKRLLQSKEYQDAIEVLSSNRDIFLKILQDPYSFFLQHIKNDDMSPPVQKRHVAVSKSTQKIETNNENLVKQKHPLVNKREWGTIKQSCNGEHWNSDSAKSKAENSTHPTRIVVLKPSSRKPHDMKAKVTPPNTLCKLLEQGGFFRELGDGEALRSRSIAEKITQQGPESISCHQRGESLLSSVNVNRCVDGISFNKPENVTIEDGGSFTDLDSPTSRCSWEYTNRTSSSCSALTFSQTSNSPMSSAIMEAKKQLLERWALVASKANNQEQTQFPRCSFSLGDMLAIPVVKEGEHDDDFTVSSSRSCGQEVEMELSTPCITNGKINNVEMESSKGNLSRSKSVPISHSGYEHIGLTGESSEFWGDKSTKRKEIAKYKNDKSSFKEKISTFFFSKIKKKSREKPVSPLMGSNDRAQSGSAESANPLYSNLPMGSSQLECEEISGNKTSPSSVTVVTKKAYLSIEQPKTCNNLRYEIKFRVNESSKSNQDQPSPTSVQDAPFEDETNDSVSQSSETNAGPHALSRASPIESVARSLSWDNVHLNMPSPNISELNRESCKVDNNEQEHFVFIQKLLSSSGLEKTSLISAQCHSLDSQLDPMLLHKFHDGKEDETRHWERGSKQDLRCDCLNSALVEVGSTNLTTLQSEGPWTKDSGGALWNVPDSSAASIGVWDLVRNSFSIKTMWARNEGDDNSSLVVDRMLGRKVGGCRLAESMRLEVQEITEEISGDVFQDLVGEALADISAECF